MKNHKITHKEKRRSFSDTASMTSNNIVDVYYVCSCGHKILDDGFGALGTVATHIFGLDNLMTLDFANRDEVF